MNDINFNEIIKEFPEGIILLDENLNIKFCNNTIINLLNYKDQVLTGKNLRSIDFIQENQKI